VLAVVHSPQIFRDSLFYLLGLTWYVSLFYALLYRLTRLDLYPPNFINTNLQFDRTIRINFSFILFRIKKKFQFLSKKNEIYNF
jgi:hypothetical protein